MKSDYGENTAKMSVAWYRFGVVPEGGGEVVIQNV
jgi:hypothetical protein